MPDDNITVTDDNAAVSGEPVADEIPDADALALASLKADLNRTGNFPGDDNYLLTLIAAARDWLNRQGVRDDDTPSYRLILVSTAAWIYRKRVTGDAQPAFLRRMIHDFKLSGVGKDESV